MSEIDCDDVLLDLEHYVDGELEPSRSADLARHLAECGPCLHRADFQRRLKEIVHRKCSGYPEPPGHLLERLRSAIRSEAGDPPVA